MAGSKLLGGLLGHLSLVRAPVFLEEIDFISDKHDNEVAFPVLLEAVEPCLNGAEGVLLGHIVDQDGAQGPTIVRTTDRSVTLLSS